MTDRIVRALTLRPCTYRSPDGAWHRDYPGDWKGPMKRDHFEQLSGRGEAVAIGGEIEGKTDLRFGEGGLV